MSAAISPLATNIRIAPQAPSPIGPSRAPASVVQPSVVRVTHAQDGPGTSDAFLHITQKPSGWADAVTYASQLEAQAGTSKALQVWEQSPDDELSALMGRNAAANTQQRRLAGVGAALLQHLADTGTGYRQTVVNTGAVADPAQVQNKATDAYWAFRGRPSGTVTLDLQTQSGATVRLSIVDQRDAGVAEGTGMSVAIEVEGELSAQEREALRALAEGFDKAIDGLSSETPRADLQGLLQAGSGKLFTGLQLRLERYGPDERGNRVLQMDARIRADASSHEVDLTTRLGTVRMKTDLRQPAQWGTEQQKADTIARFLDSISAAAERGKARDDLAELFKSTFSALHGSYGAQGSQTAAAKTEAVAPSAADRSFMSGLADYEASVTAATRALNPRRTTELDTFDYRLGQATRIGGGSDSQRNITQTQTAQLVASFHRALLSSAEPKLDTTAATQNYRYDQVEERSSTELQLAYDKDHPVAAMLTQRVSQLTRSLTVKDNQVVQDLEVPSAEQTMQADLLPQLLEQLRRQREAGARDDAPA